MANPDKCNEDVYKHGESQGLYDMRKEDAEALCERLTEETGRAHDWHYIGGRVHIKALPQSYYDNLQEAPWA